MYYFFFVFLDFILFIFLCDSSQTLQNSMQLSTMQNYTTT